MGARRCKECNLTLDTREERRAGLCDFCLAEHRAKGDLSSPAGETNFQVERTYVRGSITTLSSGESVSRFHRYVGLDDDPEDA